MTGRRPPGPAGKGGDAAVAGTAGEAGGALSLEEVMSAVERCTQLSELRPGVWAGANVVLPGYRRLFGGQLLAQAIGAAAVAPPGAGGKVVRSVHLGFTAEGRPELPVEWSVEAVHDGRTFATRSVTARQGEQVLAAGVVSLHTPDSGPGVLSHSAVPPAVRSAADLPAIPQLGAMALELRCELGDGGGEGAHDADAGADGVPVLDGLAVGPPELAVWMRAHRAPRLGAGGPPAVGAQLAGQQLLAYSSDLTMMVAAMRPHDGIGFGSPNLLASAVTSHTVSFHQGFAIEDWLLFAQSSPVAAGGRAYIRGDWFTEAGAVVASCAQEVLIRVAPPQGGTP